MKEFFNNHLNNNIPSDYEQSENYFLKLPEEKKHKIIGWLGFILSQNVALRSGIELNNNLLDSQLKPEIKNIIGGSKTRKAFFVKRIRSIIASSVELFEDATFAELYGVERGEILQSLSFLEKSLFDKPTDDWMSKNKNAINSTFITFFYKGIENYLDTKISNRISFDDFMDLLYLALSSLQKNEPESRI